MHKDFMLAALEQAWLGRGSCAPNPSVGALAVHKGEIIAKAWHQGAGRAHAEQLVLEQLPPGLSDLILYVTLEPCNHFGKTPPCTEAIMNYGVSQVVYGYSDPNPLVAANNTPKLLKDKSIEILHYPLAEIDQFYQSYFYWSKTKKPWVTAKMALSLDGKIGKKDERIYLSNEDCAEFTHYQRLHSDVILTTAKTILADDPLLNVRLNGKEEPKVIAILDSHLSLPTKAKIFSKAKHCHIYHDERFIPNHPSPNSSYHAVPSNKDLLDLTFILSHLGELGYHDLWVEAGGQLFSALQQQRLIHRAYLYFTPILLGEKAISAFQGDAIFSNKLKINWQIKGDNVIACIDL